MKVKVNNINCDCIFTKNYDLHSRSNGAYFLKYKLMLLLILNLDRKQYLKFLEPMDETCAVLIYCITFENII